MTNQSEILSSSFSALPAAFFLGFFFHRSESFLAEAGPVAVIHGLTRHHLTTVTISFAEWPTVVLVHFLIFLSESISLLPLLTGATLSSMETLSTSISGMDTFFINPPFKPFFWSSTSETAAATRAAIVATSHIERVRLGVLGLADVHCSRSQYLPKLKEKTTKKNKDYQK